MKVLLSGGAGYIGSHVALLLLEAGHNVVIVDNLQNSSEIAIDRVRAISGRAVEFYRQDLLESEGVAEMFAGFEPMPDAVIHFAGLKAVGESVTDPLLYYQTNLSILLNLAAAMARHDINRLVFSSSATVYGEPREMPITEATPVTDAASPYGRTKLFQERIIEDLVKARPGLRACLLRYFNPAGAHPSGQIGEDPVGRPNNLVPFVTQYAAGRQSALVINGDDYPTPDGTCIRDYIHVMDLAAGHLAALDRLARAPDLQVYNLGTGQGASVLEVVNTFAAVNQLDLPYTIGARRAGDIPASFTSPALAEAELGWRATRTLEDICRDAWRWQLDNPEGYGS